MINRDGFFTSRYDNIAELKLAHDSIYLYHQGIETRSATVADPRWQKSMSARFVDINLINPENDEAEIVSSHKRFSLRSQEQVMDVISQNDPAAIYIDSSGMSVRILAPFLKTGVRLAMSKEVPVYVVYVEPSEYDVKKFNEGGSFYNLAEGFNELTPLPAFSSFLPVRGKTALIPMLGFEGGRFEHILNQSSSEVDLVIPIVGLAGYRPEYPFVSFVGNRRTLEETDSWTNVKYAMAGSIVDAVYELKRIKETYQDVQLWKLAPIGTKPHTIAALLFAILNPLCTEIVYDNPTRKKARTQGVGKMSVTSISRLIAELR